MAVEIDHTNWWFIGCTICGTVIKTLPQHAETAIAAHPHDPRFMVTLFDEEDARSQFGGGLMQLEIQLWPPTEEEDGDAGPDEPLILDND